MRTPASLVALLSFAFSAHAGPISDYYLSAGTGTGAGRQIRVIRGNAIVNAFTPKNTAYALAVTDAVRTYSFLRGVGSEYTLAGTATGVDYPLLLGGPLEALDGATDGSTRNFLVNAANRGVYQFTFDWEDPELLFTLPTTPTGITFDQKSRTLWIARDGDRVIEEYTLDGDLLTSFSYQSTSQLFRLVGLAWEPATDTLWGFIPVNNQLRQFDKTGKLLEQSTVPGQLLTFFGGEFALPPLPAPPAAPEPAPSVATPEPGSLVVLAVAIVGLIGADVRRRRNGPRHGERRAS